MKKLRFLSTMLCLCLVLALLPSAALAVSGTHNGLDMSLTTDKSKYAAGETVTAVVTVVNTNRFSAHNCSVKLELPDGLVLADGTAGVAPLKLIIGCTDSATFKLAMQDTMLTVPKTGGELQTGLWILLSVATAGALLVLVVKRKRLSGSLLCVMLCAAMLLAAPSAALAASKSFSVTETITINGQEYPITATLYYELDDRTREAPPEKQD